MNIVPKSDEIVFLSDISNIHQGGESFDITDFVPDSVKIVSEKACRSIDGLGSAGVDIIYNGERERTPKIIEINTSPNFGIHYYPMYGPQRNPAKSIVMRMINQTVPH